MDNVTKGINPKYILFFVFILVITGQSAVDIYLPSFPAMVEFFHTTKNMVQLSLSSFLVGYGGSQLIYGPLSDHFGRRPVLLFGMILFSVASVLCFFSASIEMFLLFRLLQGIGVSVANVHQRALIRDIYSGKLLNKNASYVATIWALVPLVAPTIGGHIQYYLNWKINFIFLALVGFLLSLAIGLKLPETSARDQHAKLTFKKVIKDYLFLLTNKVFIGNVMCCAFLSCIFTLFNVAGPFLLQIELNFSPITYGWILIVSGGGFFVGSFCNSYCSQFFSTSRIITIGFIIIFFNNVIMLYFACCHLFTINTLIIPLCCQFLGVGFVYANCAAGAMRGVPILYGSAGAFFGFIVLATGSLFSAIFSWISTASFIQFALSTLITSVLSLIFYFLLVVKIESLQPLDGPDFMEQDRA